MKKRYTILLCVASWPVLLLGFLPFMPNPFPWQYHFDGTVSRKGSPFELILYVLLPVIIGWAIGFWLIQEHQKQGSETPFKNEKFIIRLITVFLLVIELLFCWNLYKGFQYADTGTSTEITVVFKTMTTLLGLGFILYGNQMPRAAYKSTFGMQNRWSLDSEPAWMATQRGVGILFICGGIIIIILNLLFLSPALTILMPVLCLAAGSYFISYLACKKNGRP